MELLSALPCLFQAFIQSTGSLRLLAVAGQSPKLPSGLQDGGRGVHYWARTALSETSSTLECFEFFLFS